MRKKQTDPTDPLDSTSQLNRKYITNFILFSAGYILLGLLLLIAPERSKQVICTVLGIVLLASGIGRIVWHFVKDDLSRTFTNDIPVGVIMLLAGVYMIARGNLLWNWLPVLMGFAVVFDSIIKIQHAFDLRRTGFGPWLAVLILSLATGVLGVLLIMGVVGPNLLLAFFGIVLIVDGVANLATMTLLIVSTKRHMAGKAQAEPAEAPPAEADAPAPVDVPVDDTATPSEELPAPPPGDAPTEE